MLRIKPRHVVAIIVLLAFAGCESLPFGYTSIREIVAAPGQFDGKEVKLRGTVTGGLKVPVIDIKGYTLRDDTGEIPVLTHGTLPATNARVALTGVVKSLAIIGGESLGLRVEEIKRLREDR
ncbi:MAG TPA: hypothetical protein VLN59_02850 [Burkholderiales bacterium]|nr:hypothetical protein [Burkholderiales bacterium]